MCSLTAKIAMRITRLGECLQLLQVQAAQQNREVQLPLNPGFSEDGLELAAHGLAKDRL